MSLVQAIQTSFEFDHAEMLYRVRWKALIDKGNDTMTGKWLGFSEEEKIFTTRRAMPMDEAKNFVEYLEEHRRDYKGWNEIVPADKCPVK